MYGVKLYLVRHMEYFSRSRELAKYEVLVIKNE